MNQQASKQTFNLGGWNVDPLNNCLRRVDEPETIIRPKVMQLLVELVENQGQTVTREELIERVWHGNEYVGDRGLTDAVWQLRKCLDSDTRHSPYIETIPKTGYRLLVSATDFTGQMERTSASGTKLLPQRSIKWLALGLIISAVLVAFVIGLSSNDPVEPEIVFESEIKQLNQLPGFESLPRLSPDGRYISFTYHSYTKSEEQIRKKGYFDLYIQEMNKPDSQPINVTRTGRPAGYSSWSQDSSELAFMTLDDNQQCKLKIILLATRELTEITNCTTKYAKGLSWSHDQRYLAYTDEIDPALGPGIIIYDLKTKQKKQITSKTNDVFSLDFDVIWSENDDYLIFIRTEGVDNDDIYTVDLNGVEQRATNISTQIFGLTLGAESNSVYFSVLESKASALWQVNVKTQRKSKLKISDKTAINPAYSKSSKTLAFIRRSFITNIVSLNLNANKTFEQEHVIAATTAVNTYPSYSEVNDEVVFISNRSGREQLWSTAFNHAKIKQLTNVAANTQMYGAQWSPDGSKIAYTASVPQGKYKQIHYLDVNSGEIAQLTHNPTDHGPPTWSRDSQSIYTGEFDHDVYYLWKYDLEGSGEKLFEQPGIYGFESAKGIYYFTKIEHPGIWSYDLKTKKSALFLADLKRGDGSNWTLTDGGIYYLSRTKITDDIRFYSFADQSNVIVYQYPRRHIDLYQSFDYRAKSNELLLVKRIQPGSNIYYMQYP